MQHTPHLSEIFSRSDTARICFMIWIVHTTAAMVIVLAADYFIVSPGPNFWDYIHQTIVLTVLATTLLSVPTTLLTMRLVSRMTLTRRSLEQQASTDYLTRLLNRRAFEAKATRHLTRSHPGALLLIDADHFKRVNDTHGHNVGDVALTAIANVLRQSVRDGDIVGRIGGEEFAVLMTSGCPDSAHRLAERLRLRVEEIKLTDPATGQRVPLTISVGITPIGGRVSTLDRCYSLADAALYAAKQAGRNRVRFAPSAALAS